MDAARYERIAAVFEAASRLAGADRAAYLEQACDGDGDLRATVASMLEASEDAPATDAFADERIDATRRRLERTFGAAGGGPPGTIGGYRIVRRIAAGGMGTVYKAEQAHPRRRVAIKIVHAHIATSALTGRLRREAEILGRLQHPGIAQVFDAGTHDDGEGGRPWFAMEFIDGRPLTAWAAEQGLDVRGRLELFTRICDAVAYAHGHGIVHRDLKPDNILVDGRGQVKVLDFGIARITAESTIVDHSMTQTGQIIGTLGYMAPEQLGGGAEAVDARADVYALGVILHELLAGRLPHAIAGMSLTRALRTICDERPAPMHFHDASLRGDLTTIVEKAIDVEPHRRYDSVGALATDVRRHLESRPILARPTSHLYIARTYVRRNRVLVGGIAATLLVLVAGLVAALVLAGQRNAQRRRADERALEAQRNLVEATGAVLENANGLLEGGRIHEAAALLDRVHESVRGWSWWLLHQAAPTPVDLPPNAGANGTIGFIPDGRLAYLTNTRNELTLIDPVTGAKEPAPADRAVTHQSWFGGTTRRVAWSDTEAVITDLATGAILRRLPHPVDPDTGATAVMQNPSMVSDDGRVVVLDYTTFCEVRVDDAPPWRFPKVKSTYVPVTPEGGTLLVSDGRGGVDVYDVATRSRIGEVRAERAAGFTAVLPIPHGFLFRFARDEPNLHETWVYDRVGDAIVRRDLDLSPERHTVMSTTMDGAYAALGTWFVRSGRGTRAIVRDTRTAQALRTFSVPDANGVWAVLSADGRRLGLLPFHETPSVLRLDLEHRATTLLPAVGVTAGYVYELAVSRDGSLLATSSPREDRVRLWDAVTMECVGGLLRRTHERVAADAIMLFTGEDDRLVVTTPTREGPGAAVVEWSLADGAVHVGQRMEAIGDHHAALLDAVIDRAGPEPRARLSRRAAMIGDGAVAIARNPFAHQAGRRSAAAPSGTRWHVMPEPGIGDEDTRGLSAHPTLPRVAVVSAGFFESGHYLRIRDLETGSVLVERELPAPPWCVAYSPDGTHLAVGDNDGFVTIFECAFDSRQLRFRAGDPETPYDYVHALAWLPDGERLATVSGDATVRTWDARSWREQVAARDAWVSLRQTMAAREDLAAIYPTLTGAERAAARIELIRRRGPVAAE